MCWFKFDRGVKLFFFLKTNKFSATLAYFKLYNEFLLYGSELTGKLDAHFTISQLSDEK